MAWEEKVCDITLKAYEDLSSDQYRIVVQDTTNGKIRRPNAITDVPLGILQNAPDAEDQPAVVRLIGCGGVSKVVLGATLAYGAIIACEYQSASDAGKAQAAVSTQYPVGLLLLGGDEDDLGSALMTSITVVA